MVTSDCFVSVIAPLSNDSSIVEPFTVEVMQVLRDHYINYELVLINDGSEDDTLEKVALLLKKYECIRIINLSRSFGIDIAISSGLDSVIGDFVVVMLPASDPPQLIPELIQQCRNGSDIIIGTRKNRFRDPLWTKVGANLFYWCCKRLFKIPLTKNSTQFWVLSRQVVNSILQVQDKHCYLRLLSLYVGYKSRTFTYELIKRYKKPKTKGLFELLNLALQIIFINSVHPLRLASYLGLLASSLNLVYIGYIFIIFLFKKHIVEGWVTLSVQNAIMFQFIFIILIVVCEYVGLMFAKARGWPAYYIINEKTSSVLILDRKRKNVVQDSQVTQV